MPIKEAVRASRNAIQQQFGREFSQTAYLWEMLQHAEVMTRMPKITPVEAMERLRCRTAPEVLCGALYACETCGDDFDTALITAVNHSGRSAAVGAITGAIMAIRMGEAALPEFYLECLEAAPLLSELADDMAQGCPMDATSRLFDDDWDRKYLRGGI